MGWSEWILVLLPLLLSWPVAVVVIAFVFRRPIENALSEIKRLKIGNNEIERFDRAIEQSERVIDEMEQLQIMLADAQLTEMRAVDASPYVPPDHKPLIKDKADQLERHLNKLKAKQAEKNDS